MLMVIFGAGASYDSAAAFPLSYLRGANSSAPIRGIPLRGQDDPGPWRPPLADDLFRDPNHAFGHIVQRYPKLSHILPYLREPSGGRSVEEELESLQAHRSAERHREFASVTYYLRDLLFEVSDEWRARTSGITNYAPLIGEILNLTKNEEPVCLVTFNYDLLLDRALTSFGLEPQGLEPEYYFLHPRLKLFKPHGSVNWARFIDRNHDTRPTPAQFCDRADMIRLTDEFTLVSSVAEANNHPQERTVFPCIAIPFQNKTEDTFAWPPSHPGYLKGLLPDITKILIIGWRAREAHFLEILRNSKLPQLRHIMVVGSKPQDAQATLEYFVDQIGKEIGTDLLARNCSTGSGGFTQFIIGREAEGFLQTQ